ncbi:hypothetical protein LN042_28385 [Kitasatospora sp. RB6PN24]|uniref:hypothetical protein n=1 Tax=Kitasatospora humi TaxID=2893891 RepID=UPI001E2D02C8|nr:hypothetical protein [Kitasatospora humi]MCC9310942.1 hypothetical protein [Kitasatospora humi]
MQPQPSEVRRDLDAALEARRELGPEYESELVDSFLARVDARLDARVEQRVAERLAARDRDGLPQHRPFRGGRSKLPYFSLVLAVPLTGIGITVMDGFGVVIAWAGIVGVNLAAALGHRLEREERRMGDAARSEWA